MVGDDQVVSDKVALSKNQRGIEMRSAIAKVALNIAAPFILDVVKDMIKPEGITIFKDKTEELLRGLAAKTDNTVDDMLVDALFEKAFNDDAISEYGLKLVSMAKGYVVMTETKYDDKFALPILQRFEEVLTVQ